MTMRAALRADAHACFAAALAAVEPGRLVARALARAGDEVVLCAPDGSVLARHRGSITVVGAGKAVVAMARAAVSALGPAVAAGLVIAPAPAPADVGPIAVRGGAHPVPDAAAAASTAALLDRVERARADTLVLVLLSGGASALLAAPAAGIGLDDMQALTRAMLAAGAKIGDLNAVRKHCSRVTGGGLARATAHAAATWTLVLSDVPGDDPSTIASGPTVGDPTTYADALAALSRLGVVPPPAVGAHLRRGADGSVAETPKPGDAIFARVETRLVGTNGDAVAAAAGEAAKRGYAVTAAPRALRGDAASVGAALADTLLALPGVGPVALVAGGETTVRAVAGGAGGRSQHLAVAAAMRLPNTSAVLLAAGTDGIDGPTDAAGGCVDGETIARARAAGFDPAEILRATDSHRLLHATGDLVVTGPTGTNVADLVVALRPRA
jgi:glycerate-2-kinase